MQPTTHWFIGLCLITLAAPGCGPSTDTLQARAATGEVQVDAPLHAVHAIDIDAPRERVFGLITDVAGWPRWQPTVSGVTPPERFAPGEPFTWVNAGSEIHSRVAAVEPSALVAWTGTVATAKAVHVWRLTTQPGGATRVEVEESMDGFLLTWFYSQSDLEAEMARSLENLRRAAESAP